MAQDKRGQIPEPQIEDGLDELTNVGVGEDGLAESTTRNSVGDAKRAAAKATGLMGASRKLDPDLDIRHADGGRVKSGSGAGIHSFSEVPADDSAEPVSLTLSNEEVAAIRPTTVLKSPALRPEFTQNDPKPMVMKGGAESRRRVPAPGTMVDVPKGKLLRGKA
ncbi:hypothetical protein [Microvirga antarctica]|uniref:hypothetical protein n=1 Tax=Microvirga antarctica TaxID=2819233 RepID=UPI001B30C53A|nr:hypothetical protein [Microvirga antarctica]